MPPSTTWLQNARINYMFAKTLTENYQDSEEEPYRSKYAARTRLMTMLDEVDRFLEEGNLENYSPVRLLSILLNLEIGVIDQETEELSTSEQHLTKAKALCEEWYPDDNLVIVLRLNILNQLSYLYTMRADYEKALSILQEAQSYFEKWTTFKSNINGEETKKIRTVIEFLDCFEYNLNEKMQDSNGEVNLDKTFTQTLYFLAQVYEKMGDSAKSAVYCYKTLKKQLILNHYKTLEWCINTATLSQYFAGIDKFGISSHLLRVAKAMMDSKLPPKNDDDEDLKKGRADFQRIMVKYYLMLLDCSFRHYTSEKSEKTNGQKPLQEQEKVEEYRLLEEDELNRMSCSTIIDKLVEFGNFDQAKAIFVEAQKLLNLAKEYYTLNEHASDYVDCIQDHSKLYRHLSSFDYDVDRKCKMYKRRVDMLEEILKEINPKHFMAQCRQIWFELGEAYNEMYEMKVSKEKDQVTTSAKKLNSLLKKSTEHFVAFIDSFRENKNEPIPPKVPDEMVKPLIIAYFGAGRNYTKLLTADKKDVISNWNKCEEFYSQAVKYIDNNPDQKSQIGRAHV